MCGWTLAKTEKKCHLFCSVHFLFVVKLIIMRCQTFPYVSCSPCSSLLITLVWIIIHNINRRWYIFWWSQWNMKPMNLCVHHKCVCNQIYFCHFLSINAQFTVRNCLLCGFLLGSVNFCRECWLSIKLQFHNTMKSAKKKFTTASKLPTNQPQRHKQKWFSNSSSLNFNGRWLLLRINVVAVIFH